MATQSRAQRRAHDERVKSRTRRVMRLWAGRRSAPVDPRELGVNASTHCRPCGCWKADRRDVPAPRERAFGYPDYPDFA